MRRCRRPNRLVLPVDPAQVEPCLRIIREQQWIGMCHLCRDDGQRHGDEDDAGGEEAMKGVATGTSLGCAPVLYETLAAVFTCRAITLVDLACILFLFNSL